MDESEYINLAGKGFTSIADVIKSLELKECDKVISLNLWGNKIKDFNGIECFIALQELNLAQNALEKIPIIRGLYQLKTLGLSRNRISKIENLLEFEALEKLNLSENLITKILGLENLPKLRKLILAMNDIEKIENLEELKDLEELNLNRNKITQIENLDTLKKLRKLDISVNDITEINGLNDNSLLEELYLYSNKITNIDNVNHLSLLKIFYLFNNRIRSISGLDGLSNLGILILQDNSIEKIEGLESLISLERLELPTNKIERVENLDTLINLKFLLLQENKLVKMEGIEKLASLEVIDMSGNKISKIENLEGLKRLSEIYMDDNNINIITGLIQLPSLQRISLKGNKLTNCDVFSELSLMELDLRDNPIIDCEELVKIPDESFGFHSLVPGVNLLKIDVDNIIHITEGCKDKFNDRLDSLIRTALFFTSSIYLEKEYLNEIIILYNAKLSIEEDGGKRIDILGQLVPYFQRRIGLEIRDSEDYSILRGLGLFIASTICADNHRKMKLFLKVKKIYSRLNNKKYERSINSVFNLLLCLDLFEKKDLEGYRLIMSKVVDDLYGRLYDTQMTEKNSLSQPSEYVDFIIHRLISRLLRAIQSEYQVSLLTTSEKLFPRDIKLQDAYCKLFIEHIPIVEHQTDLIDLKIYFTNINIRKWFFKPDGSFQNDRKSEMIAQIKGELDGALESDANFILFPEYCFPSEILPYLKEFSDNYNIIIIGGVERFKNDVYKIDMSENCAFIFIPNGPPLIQKKNYPGKSEPDLKSARNIKIIHSKFGTFAVLICADFLHDVTLLKLRNEVDFIIVPAFNKDVNTFHFRALDRCYANLCYIFIINIKKYGSSRGYAPRRGGKRELLDLSPTFNHNLSEFRDHRRCIESSQKYKPSIKDILKD